MINLTFLSHYLNYMRYQNIEFNSIIYKSLGKAILFIRRIYLKIRDYSFIILALIIMYICCLSKINIPLVR